MKTPSLSGAAMAAIGALILTPDALLMRLSDMDGAQMLAWRGLCVGTVYWGAWLLWSRDFRALATVASGAGITLVLCQYFNAMLFPLGIAAAPVSVVLLAVATMPVWAAVLSRIFLGEQTSRATWITIVAVLSGIGIAVSGKGSVAVNTAALTGALCGFGVALCLALSFVTLRRMPHLPLLPALGTGALMSGTTGLILTGPERLIDGVVPAIMVTGLFILPVSFFALAQASRRTQAATVSLLMLLETVLGPVWVWLFLDEAPTARMLTGGAIVLGALALYIRASQPRRRTVRSVAG